jgi:hypothetical protein
LPARDYAQEQYNSAGRSGKITVRVHYVKPLFTARRIIRPAEFATAAFQAIGVGGAGGNLLGQAVLQPAEVLKTAMASPFSWFPNHRGTFDHSERYRHALVDPAHPDRAPAYFFHADVTIQSWPEEEAFSPGLRSYLSQCISTDVTSGITAALSDDLLLARGSAETPDGRQEGSPSGQRLASV